METVPDLQHAPAFRWLISAEGRTVSKMMNSVHGSIIAESHFSA